jgi:hypothetical protein
MILPDPFPGKPGKPSGSEGYLADSFRFLQAVLLREASFRERLYRPLTAGNP